MLGNVYGSKFQQKLTCKMQLMLKYLRRLLLLKRILLITKLSSRLTTQAYLILDVNGDVFLLPENCADENRHGVVGLHQVDDGRLHEGEVGESGRGE